MLRQLVKVVIEEGDEKEIREYHVDRLKFKSRHRKDNQKLSKEEMKGTLGKPKQLIGAFKGK